MAENLDTLNTAVSLLIRAALLAARFSGLARKRSLKRLATKDVDAQTKEILFLKDRVYQLEMQVSILQKHLNRKGQSPRYTVRERLLILWHVEAFQIPRRKVPRYFGIGRSTLYRWLRKIEDEKPSGTPANKTTAEIATLVWEITKANLSWDRIRIANQLKLLGIFLSASTVRNILQRPKPPDTPAAPATPEKTEEKPESRSIPAWYPNHVWSVDTTKALCWELWPIEVLVAIDHFSRKVVCAAPLEGPNAGWIVEAQGQAMRRHGAPKRIISDQAKVFVGDVFAELLNQWNIKPRVGAVGKHGSIAVTERIIKTLKCESLRRVPLIKGLDHVMLLCTESPSWYNASRPHMIPGRSQESAGQDTMAPKILEKDVDRLPQGCSLLVSERGRVPSAPWIDIEWRFVGPIRIVLRRWARGSRRCWRRVSDGSGNAGATAGSAGQDSSAR